MTGETYQWRQFSGLPETVRNSAEKWIGLLPDGEPNNFSLRRIASAYQRHDGRWMPAISYNGFSVSHRRGFYSVHHAKRWVTRELSRVMNPPTIEPPTLVLFRRDRRAAGEVTAVFPEMPGTNDPGTMSCYAHVGQHSSCSKEWLQTTRPATPTEYACLKRELESAPYWYDLIVRQRITRQMDDNRRAELRRLNPRYVVDGHEFENEESNMAGDGNFPPFRIFDTDKQDYVGPEYPTRAAAEAALDLLKGKK